METRALDAERQARSATLQVIALEDMAAFRTVELDNFKRDFLAAQAKLAEDSVPRSVPEDEPQPTPPRAMRNPCFWLLQAPLGPTARLHVIN